MTTTDDRPVTSQPLDQRHAAFVLAVLQTVKDEAAARYKAAQQIAAEHYFQPGDRLTAKDLASGDKLGSVSMTDPSRKATVEDRDAFTAYMAEEDPDSVVTSEAIDPDRLDEAYDVLRKHAPDLLVQTTVVRVQHEKAALDHAAATGDPIPGVEVRQPLGVVTARISREGKELIRAQIAAGQVDALRELPAKET